MAILERTSRASAELTACAAASCSGRTTESGAFAGRNRADQVIDSSAAKPTPRTVGTGAAEGERAGLGTPRIRALPPPANGHPSPRGLQLAAVRRPPHVPK